MFVSNFCKYSMLKFYLPEYTINVQNIFLFYEDVKDKQLRKHNA